jgi:hypothetical protein
MIRIMNGKTVKQPKVDTRAVVQTIVFVVLVFAALAFFAVAGHI